MLMGGSVTSRAIPYNENTNMGTAHWEVGNAEDVLCLQGVLIRGFHYYALYDTIVQVVRC